MRIVTHEVPGETGGELLEEIANGTLTFRRSSTTPTGHAPNPSPSHDHAVQPPSVEESPQATSAHEPGPSRYTKDELLDMFRSQKPTDDPSHLFMSGWNPASINGSSARSWGRTSDSPVPQEPGACWDSSGVTTPMGLQGFSLEEKEVGWSTRLLYAGSAHIHRQAFSADINSPLKPPTQKGDGHQGIINGRKSSVSHGTGNAFGVGSPASTSRQGTRRRETMESNPFGGGGLVSPTTASSSRFSRDESSPWPARKSNDLKESEPDEADADHGPRDASAKSSAGSLPRIGTSVGGTGVSAIWPPQGQITPGVGGFGNFALPHSSVVGDKRVGGGVGGGGSRLAHLIPKESHDNSSKAGDGQQSFWRSRPRTDTDPFGGDEELSGSAVLGGSQDITVGGHAHVGRVGVLGTPIKASTGEFGMSGLAIAGQMGDNGPVSPSETNPYRSPPAERHDVDDGDGAGVERAHAANQHEQHANFASAARGFGAAAFEGSDRSQTSSVGPKGYSLSGLSGWPAPGVPSAGTPDRERQGFGNAFGSSLFSPVGDLQSPGLSNLSNVVFGPGNISRGSKLGSLFPPVMQAQMQSHEPDHGLSDSAPDPRQTNPLGAIGRGSIAGPSRDTESPMRSARGMFEDLFPSSDVGRSHGAFHAMEATQPTGAAPGSQSFTPVSGEMAFGPQSGNEPPVSQVRQMVMPDRMRWVYLDPQGQVQGPFTGLEMNDWYKANFFTPDLRVKKVEDPEFEPLGQLIRRIGNSREPFLVPQIGIPHGPPSQSGPFTSSTNGGGVVPPLSGVFPSFGRTLTAEEQNNLERRKQEEQYLMAQQREFMLRQQAMTKFQIQGGPGLQHHSSVHSLQSQPSFGSMASPIGVAPPPLPPPQQQQQQQHQPHQPQHQPQQAPPPIGSMPLGIFSDHGAGGQPAMRVAPGGTELLRTDDLASLGLTERQVLGSLQGDELGAQQHERATQGDSGMRSGLPEMSQLADDPEGFRERFQEFETLRAQHEEETASDSKATETPSPSAEFSDLTPSAGQPPLTSAPSGKAGKAARRKNAAEEAAAAAAAAAAALSLTQQVQKTQAAAAVEPDMPMPFPPPSSSTPLPAPTAQRVRSNLPEQYSRSQSGSPEAVQPPPMAPWAKEPGVEGQKGPSLKEIQEAETRKAARAEEAAAALRKASLEQENALLREKERRASASTAAGLPPTSTWGHGSPVLSSGPWSKPGPAKGPAPGLQNASTTATSKKTLAEIQREEEVRKQKSRDRDGGAHPSATSGSSKSYANLAGKPGQTAAAAAANTAAAGSGWATVGAGGKVKAPTGPAAVPGRGGSAKTAGSVVKVVSKPAANNNSSNNNTNAGANGRTESTSAAMEEFSKWTRRELSRGLTNVTDISEFQADLDALPLDTGVIADAVYINSKTMDGRHFAEEYVRRKKLAEKGIAEKQQLPVDSGKSGAGWSEVAKRSGGGAQTKDGDAGGVGFKVVPNRKKGKK
ncbi:hypothetical protein CDD80_4402 [Ophiocordyceps camponoti-rufipedis]|uniref:GYF domain-containing protein n=1 Tax=Ophiocordyceps camponoti-rufipedis TaxID=2004952 RepID=A0A2C5YZ26_9HYPO|nr:hypothetical protein CDD80_4402 [Ophiocordyceps camponoti-rufipedis]